MNGRKLNRGPSHKNRSMLRGSKRICKCAVTISKPEARESMMPTGEAGMTNFPETICSILPQNPLISQSDIGPVTHKSVFVTRVGSAYTQIENILRKVRLLSSLRARLLLTYMALVVLTMLVI